ncbi:MAG TPA: flagellar biosynthetic protein FliO [Gammaproteobacteria bacterium]|nr:flagellar biosynthetic protein FliO [Gammaproteobacteria bacterium]
MPSSRLASSRAAPGALAKLAALSLLLPEAAAAAPDAGATATQLIRLVLGLVAVLGVLVVAARALPRLGARGFFGGDALRIVAQLPLGQRERVVVLQVGDRQVMLGVAPGRVEMLHVLEEPLPTKAGAPLADAPRGWLARALAGRRQ